MNSTSPRADRPSATGSTIRFDLRDGIATLTFDQPDSSVNTLSAQWQEDLSDVVARIVKDKDAIRGIILASAKATFFAGADLRALMRCQSGDGPRQFAEIERMKKNYRTLETLGRPVVSCLNGAALGGGWEVALVGHYRVAVDDPAIALGLPEVSLGLIPGGSGITKMTRLLGLTGAQPFILEGKRFNPREGLALGLVHELVPHARDLRAAALAWIATHDGSASPAHQPWDDKNYKMPGGPPSDAKVAALLSVAPAMLNKSTHGLYPAPHAALAAMVEGAQVDFDTSLRIESRYLAKVAVTPVARSMINTFFFNLNAVRSGKSRPAGMARYQPRKVGIRGAGRLGVAIARAQASRGIQTVLMDISLEKAEAGKARCAQAMQKRVDCGRMTPAEQVALLACITVTGHCADLAACDLVIEITSDISELKVLATQEAHRGRAPGGFLATHTHALPISSLADAWPEKFIGLHFPGPVDSMKLIEIVRGKRTDDETVARAFDYVQALGKLPIVVNDGPGFFTRRTVGAFVMEGAAMLGEGIAAPAIENAAVQIGMPVGPLALLDESGLTLSVELLDRTRADFCAAGKRYPSTPGELVVERMLREFGRGGRAAGCGFYDYDDDGGCPDGDRKAGRKSLWPDLKPLFERPQTLWDIGELKDRLLYRQAVETARCLNEGVLNSVHDANIGSVFGIGFPAWTGGAMQFIYGMGLEAFSQRCDALAARFGEGFQLTEAVKTTIRQHQPVY